MVEGCEVVVSARGSKLGRCRFALLFVLRMGIGLVFIWASVPKLRYPYQFLSDVYAYRMVGPGCGEVIAAILPWLEFVLGVCLIGGILLSGALLFSVMALAMFCGVQIYAIVQRLQINCGCFGGNTAEPIDTSSVIRTGGILLAALLAYLLLHAEDRSKRNIITVSL